MAKAKEYYVDVEPDYDENQDLEASDYGEEEDEEYSGDDDDYYGRGPLCRRL